MLQADANLLTVCVSTYKVLTVGGGELQITAALLLSRIIFNCRRD